MHEHFETIQTFPEEMYEHFETIQTFPEEMHEHINKGWVLKKDPIKREEARDLKVTGFYYEKVYLNNNYVVYVSVDIINITCQYEEIIVIMWTLFDNLWTNCERKTGTIVSEGVILQNSA